MIKEFDTENICNDQSVVIYGTSTYGRLLYYGLTQKGILVDGFADRDKKESFMGCPVLDLEELREHLFRNNSVLVLGVTRALKEVVEQLKELGITEYYSGYSILDTMKLDEEGLDQDVIGAYQTRWIYDFYQKELLHHNDNAIYLATLDLVVSERCSLRCKNCSNLMQYYERPVNVDMEGLKETFDRFLKYVGCLAELRVLGGEPFMNPDFYKIIQWYADDARIMKIGIFSNATIFPKEDILKCFKHEKIVMHFSDYGELSGKLECWKKFCEENDIEYAVIKMARWHDCGKLEKRHYSEEQIREVYHKCDCRYLPTFLHGRLYNCPYAANAVNLGALENSEAAQDYLSFRTDDQIYSVAEIENFLYKRENLAACDYCSGRNYGLKSIPPYQQAKKALSYERRGDIR